MAFDNLFNPAKKASLAQKKLSFLSLMRLETSSFNEEKLAVFPEFSEHQLAGLCSILIEKGADNVSLLLEKLQQLKQAQQDELFHLLFLGRSSDWRELINPKKFRANELNALECIDYLCKMPFEQRNWWKTMASHHAKANPEPLSMTSLVNAQHYFFKKILEIDPELNLPNLCPIENVQNMKTVYARLLYLLKKAINPIEQAQYLAKLDVGMQGFMCGASYKGNYVLVTDEMGLKAENTELNWEKYRKYIVAINYPKIIASYFQGNNPVLINPQLHFATPAIRVAKPDHMFITHGLYKDSALGVCHRTIEATEYVDTIELPDTFTVINKKELTGVRIAETLLCRGEYTDAFLDQVDDSFKDYSIRLIYNNREPDKKDIKPHRAYIYCSGTPPQIKCMLLGDKQLYKITIPSRNQNTTTHMSFVIDEKIHGTETLSYRLKPELNYSSFLYHAEMEAVIINYLTTGAITPRLLAPYRFDYQLNRLGLSPEKHARILIANYIAPYLKYFSPYRCRLLEEFTPITSIIDRPIENPELLDETLMTAASTLSYGTSLEDFVHLSQKLKNFTNTTKYFYRLVGQSPFTLSFECYQKMTRQLNETQLHRDKAQNNTLQNQLLPLLAIGTIGERAYEEKRDAPTDLEILLAFLSKQTNASQLVTHFNKKHTTSTPQPILHELTALWQVTTNPDYIDRIMDYAALHGPSVYQAFVYCSQRMPRPSQEYLSIFLDSLEHLPIALEADKKSVYILLASLARPEDWTRFPALIERLSKIECSELAKLLKTVSVADSTALVSVEEILSLITALAQIPLTEPSRYAVVCDRVTRHLPTIKFRDTSVSQILTALILRLEDFILDMDEVLNSSLQSLSLYCGDEGEESQGAFILAIAKNFLTRLSSEFNDLKLLISQATTESSTAIMPAILAKIQAILHLIENPLGNLTGLKGQLIKQMVSPMITHIKKRILTMLSKYVLDTVYMSISHVVEQLNICESILDAPIEKDVKLSVRFNNFLIAQVPKLVGINLALEINESFKKHEEILELLRVLKQMSTQTTRTRRDSLLALLYRCNYFQTGERTLLIADLTALIALIASKASIHSVECFTQVFEALEQHIAVSDIKIALTTLTQHGEELSNEEFQTLFKLGLYHKTIPLVTLLELKRTLNLHSSARNTLTNLLSAIECHPHASEWPVILQTLAHLLKNTPSACEKVTDYLRISLQPASPQGIKTIHEWLSWFSNPQIYACREDIITLLQASVWSCSEEDIRLETQKNLIDTLLAIPEALTKLGDLYSRRPNPLFSALLRAVSSTNFNVDTFIHAYELDPFGHREKIQSQWSTQGVDTLVAEICDLRIEAPIDVIKQHKLARDLTYIIGIGSHYALPIGHALKPIAAFTRYELKSYLDELRSKHPIDHTSQLQGLAILCEVMFRTTGKYPYHTQIVSVLATLHFQGNLLEQIPTGQGKSVTIAMMAAMAHLFAENPLWVTVCSRNSLLTGRDYNESLDFYNYLGIRTAQIKASTPENHYTNPGILYATTADASLNRSKLTLIDKFILPTPDKQVVICDEVDGEFYDNQNEFNLSHSQEDPFINSLEWLYPLANEYIDRPEFRDERVLEEEDIDLFRRFIKTQTPDKYLQHRDKLSKYKLSQLLDAACTAQPLQEKIDFLIRTKQREVHEKTQIISEAHILVNHVEDTEATLSHGVQQCLHARLNKLHQDKIMQGELASFSCDNQIECVDSQNSHSFFKQFGRLIGCTGTAGTQEELHEAQQRFNISALLNISPRKRSALQTLATVFTESKASFFFSRSTQLDAIKRTLRKTRQQPVIIACQTIEKTQAFYEAFNLEFPGHVHMIHAENSDNQDAFEEKVQLASQAGQITIVTPLAGRGVDFKTRLAKSQNPNDLLAETLLIIETELDRYRNRRQLQGRSARDGRRGETLGIFDMSEIKTAHDISLKPLSYQERLQALTAIMSKLDHEACVEREITLSVQQLIQAYESIFDRWLYESQDKTQQTHLLSAKTQWINLSQNEWKNLLADSDPEGHYGNPYLRYNDRRELDIEVLQKLVLCFAEKIQSTVFPQCIEWLSLDTLSPRPLMTTPVFIEPFIALASPQKTVARPKLCIDPSQAYLRKHTTSTTSTAHAKYLDDLTMHHRYQARLKYWLKHSSTPPSIEDNLKQQAITDINTLTKGKPNDFILKARQLQALLEHTQERINSFWYRLTHPFSQKKRTAIANLLDTRCKQVMEELEKSPSLDTFDAFQSECKTILAMNTSWGGLAREGKTRAIRDFNQSGADFNQIFCDHKTGLGTSYLQQLNSMKTGLESRKERSGLFKNKTIYEKKTRRLEEYILEAIKTPQAKDAEPTLLDLQTRLEQDDILNASTSRFFKSSRKVTTTQDIINLQQVFTAPGSTTLS